MKPDTIASYLSTFKSYHIDQRLSLKDFNDPPMALIIKAGKRLFSSKKRNRLPVVNNILEEITKEEFFMVADLNVDKEFKVA